MTDERRAKHRIGSDTVCVPKFAKRAPTFESVGVVTTTFGVEWITGIFSSSFANTALAVGPTNSISKDIPSFASSIAPYSCYTKKNKNPQANSKANWRARGANNP
eukprot:GHVU01205426.1.p1 GENE.GHVU01205426.1~~GHVU01205426.1.p1  ORF type:complete len:105 (+),score=5.73 GHVU01205426.1:397-711(+)